MLTVKEADEELKLAAKLNPGVWEQHSISVAEQELRVFGISLTDMII